MNSKVWSILIRTLQIDDNSRYGTRTEHEMFPKPAMARIHSRAEILDTSLVISAQTKFTRQVLKNFAGAGARSTRYSI